MDNQVKISQNRLWRLFHKACADWQLLADGDHVLIGLSGGKDSLLLTELLGRQAHIYKPAIKVTAVHVRMSQRKYLTDLSQLQLFCEQAGVPLIIRDAKIIGEEKKSPCFLCAWYRRKALLQVAQDVGCNKIAFGHHQDDVLHTLLMNLVYEGRATSIPPLLKLDKMPLSLIRPMWYIPEKDIIYYAELRNYQTQKLTCEYENLTNRHRMQQLLSQLQTLNPDVRSSLTNALLRQIPKPSINS
ncbi:MAG: tRNA 2-thiocytidine biosynthesis TtcA family protein [Paludibacteraceae bacterium]|nr:tRNA 2-thiocytidine biosynthesis TtcA family protein [Paludibacteraceae bacterium]